MSDHESYIPLSRSEVVSLVSEALPATQQKSFAAFVKILLAWYHHDFHEKLERLKENYTQACELSAPAGAALKFEEALEKVVSAANFTAISQNDLNRALEEESVFRVQLFVDFEEFDKVIFYRRGKSQRTAEIARWFGFSKKNIQFTNYDQVLIYVRYKATHSRKIIIKLFENIPEADLEMLFPNTAVRMRLSDKFLIGVPAFLSGLLIITTKVGASILLLASLAAYWLGIRNQVSNIDQTALLALLSSAGALGAYLFKQFSNFKNRKIRFMKVLAENLYFKNLDNNAGVLTNVIDYAEESECKEVLLSYGELLKNGPLTTDQLLTAVENNFNQNCDFEIEDALRKLITLKLCKLENDQYTARPLDEALIEFNQRWDELFSVE